MVTASDYSRLRHSGLQLRCAADQRICTKTDVHSRGSLIYRVNALLLTTGRKRRGVLDGPMDLHGFPLGLEWSFARSNKFSTN